MRLVPSSMKCPHFFIKDFVQGALQFDADRLDLGVVLKHLVSHFPTPTRLLVATKGHCRVKHVVAVDPHRPCLEVRCEQMCLAEIFCPNACSQTVHRIIGKWENLIEFLERQGNHDWTKDLFLDNLHVLLYMSQDRRLEKVALLAAPVPSTECRSPTGEASFHIFRDKAQLMIGYQRPHLCRRVEAWADLDLPGMLSDPLNDLLKHRFLNVETRTSAADLSLVEKNGIGSASNGDFHVCVFQDNVRRLATQFKRNLFEVACRCMHDLLANFR